MTTPADWTDELRTLCDLLIDGKLSDEQQSRLEQLVLENPAARKWYTEFVHQINRALFQHARSDALFRIFTAMQFHDHGFDSRAAQQ